ncbi:MAG: hypothetical protein K9L68_13505 [Spirochaetales bacterium]|nr:hypothetical protein [Spirochaetales bacterium]MCF7939608.1 hypothetical protein [Spirochaetales bacterium]
MYIQTASMIGAVFLSGYLQHGFNHITRKIIAISTHAGYNIHTMNHTKKLFVLVCVVFFILPGIAFSQSADYIDNVLQEDPLRLGTASKLVLESAGLIDEDAGEQEAVSFVKAAEWKLSAEKADDPVNLGDFSLLIMQSFDLSGGIMYSILPGPRYASREMDFRGFLRGSPDPSVMIDGKRALEILSAVLNSDDVLEAGGNQ